MNERLTTVEACDREIARKQNQIRECVGQLYPSILRDEIAAIRVIREDLAAAARAAEGKPQ